MIIEKPIQIATLICPAVNPAYALSLIHRIACDPKSVKAIGRIDTDKIQRLHEKEFKIEIGVVEYDENVPIREISDYKFSPPQIALSFLASLTSYENTEFYKQILRDPRPMICLIHIPVKGSDKEHGVPCYLIAGLNVPANEDDVERNPSLAVRILATTSLSVLHGCRYRPIVFRM